MFLRGGSHQEPRDADEEPKRVHLLLNAGGVASVELVLMEMLALRELVELFDLPSLLVSALLRRSLERKQSSLARSANTQESAVLPKPALGVIE